MGAVGLLVKKGENQEKNGRTVTRIYPIDQYDLPPTLFNYLTKYHLLRVPVLGQHNTQNRGGDWCGRTSACMVWNFMQLAAGKVASRTDYISHWDYSDGLGMELRFPSTKVACGAYRLSEALDQVGVTVSSDEKNRVFPYWNDRQARLTKAAQIGRDPRLLEARLAPVLDSLRKNNPMVFYTGLSTTGKYRSHVVVISGFCYLRDMDGEPHLWLQITDPSTPKVGAIFTPPSDGPRTVPQLRAQDDLQYLSRLKQGENDIVRLVHGDWANGEGAVYLLRASRLFDRNTAFPQDGVLWMDYTLYERARAGGEFSTCAKETPFAERIVKSNCFNNLCFPLQDDAGKLESPLAYFERCEMPPELRSYPNAATPPAGTGTGQVPAVRPTPAHEGWGGYYPIGTNSTVHSGAHLLAGTNRPIRCVAPGYIVAARLRRDAKAAGKAHEAEFLNAYSGFVLVRHELALPAQGGGDEETFPFFSLYMHLSPTGWPDTKDEYAGVEWLRRFFLARHEAIVNLDPTEGIMGEVSWAAAATEPAAERTGVVNEADILGPPASRALKDLADRRLLAYVKNPPGNLKDAYQALAAGKIVTFSEAMLPVGPGDILGWCKPAPKRGNKSTGIASGYIHWEILAPPGPSGASAFSKLRKLAAERDIETFAVKEPVADCFWSEDEIKSVLEPLLPTGADRESLAAVLAAATPECIGEGPGGLFARNLRRLFSTASFFDEPEGGQRTVDQASPSEYRLTLRMDNAKYPLPQPSGGDYRYVVKYLAAGGHVLGKQTFHVGARRNAKVIDESLSVPAGTLSLDIETFGFFLDPGEPLTERKEVYGLAKQSLGHRWRALCLQHKTEWSEESIRTLVEKLKSLGVIPNDEKLAPYLESAWYRVETSTPPQAGASHAGGTDDPVLGEHPVARPDGGGKSLFGDGGMLPADGRIENLHPVTFLWLLKLLQGEAAGTDRSERICWLNSHWDRERSAQNEAPEFFAWCDDGSRPLVVGHPLWAVAIRPGYLDSTVSLLAKPLADGTHLDLGSGKYSQGVFVVRVTAQFWGEWQLQVANSSTSPPGQGSLEARVKIAIVAPEMSSFFDIQKIAKTGHYKLSLSCIKNCPESLLGYMGFSYLLVDVDRAFPESARWILDPTGEFIVGLSDGPERQVTASFALKSYLDKYGVDSPPAEEDDDDDGPRSPRVSANLCRAAQMLCDAFARDLRNKPPQLQVVSVSTDGLTAVLQVVDKTQGSGVAAAGTSCATMATAAFDSSTNRLTLTAVPTAASPWTRWDKCVPVVGASAAASEKVVYDEYHLVSGPRAGFNNSVHVSSSFTLREYLRAYARADQPASGFRVSPNLIAAVQALRNRFGAHQWLNLRPGSIEFDTTGRWSVTLSSAVGQSTLLAAANRLKSSSPPWFVDVVAVETKAVQVTVQHDPTNANAGHIDFEFDPGEAFGALMRDVTFDETKLLHVRVDFITRNGLPAPAFAEALNGPISALPPGFKQQLQTSDGQELAGTQSGHWLQARSRRTFKRLSRPGFEDFAFGMLQNKLLVKVPLRGAAKDWLNAKPALVAKIGSKEIALSRCRVERTRDRATLVGELGLDRKAGDKRVPNMDIVGKEATFIARITNPEAVFDMERLNPPERTRDWEVWPKIVTFAVEEAKGNLQLTAKATTFPTTARLLVRCVDASTGEDVRSAKNPDKKVQDYVRYTPEKNGAGGFCTSDGVFRADLSTHHLPQGASVKLIIATLAATVLGRTREDVGTPEVPWPPEATNPGSSSSGPAR